MNTNTTQAGARTQTQQNIIEQFRNADKALRYLSASADFDSPLQSDVDAIRFRLHSLRMEHNIPA